MRTIKFRGKDQKTGEWVYGSLLLAYNQNDKSYYTIVTERSTYIRVDPDTIGQFTGLKDHNDTEIYENDILKGEDGKLYIVLYSEYDACYYTKYIDKILVQRPLNKFSAVYFAHICIIGNINDNPELIDNVNYRKSL
jgi:uncharacterized phage protein (TIGR01671 family)